jgi:hypothetical protein
MIDETDLARIVGRITTSRKNARAALIRQWQIQFAQTRLGGAVNLDGDLSAYEPTEREQRDFCQMVIDDPRLLNANVLPMVFFVARTFCQRVPRRPPSAPEIAALVNRLAGSLPSLGAAYRSAARLTGKSEGAVKIAHLRHGGKMGGKAQRKKAHKK